MTTYYKTGTFRVDLYGYSWHKGEKDTPALVEGDDVTNGMIKCGAYGIGIDKYDAYIHIDGRPIKSDYQQLAMTNVPWIEGGVQLLERAVSTYEPVNNAQYAEILNPLTNHYPLAGIVICGKYGELLAVQMALPEYEIGGQEQEHHKGFLTITEDRRSGLKMWGAAETRTVCANTFLLATQEKGMKTLPNTRDSYAILKFRSRIEEKAIKSHQDYIAGLNHLFKTPVQSGDVNNLIAQLFPEPQKPQMVKLWENNQDVLNGDSISETVDKRGQRANQLFQNAIERNERYSRELAQNFFQFNDEFAYAANSRYSLWQATTQFFNHSQEWQSDQDVHAYNVLFGDKAKQMNLAWAILTK